jgi:hypothetical protein
MFPKFEPINTAHRAFHHGMERLLCQRSSRFPTYSANEVPSSMITLATLIFVKIRSVDCHQALAYSRWLNFSVERQPILLENQVSCWDATAELSSLP